MFSFTSSLPSAVVDESCGPLDGLDQGGLRQGLHDEGQLVRGHDDCLVLGREVKFLFKTYHNFSVFTCLVDVYKLKRRWRNLALASEEELH